jgi:hypothetical protein
MEWKEFCLNILWNDRKQQPRAREMNGGHSFDDDGGGNGWFNGAVEQKVRKGTVKIKSASHFNDETVYVWGNQLAEDNNLTSWLIPFEREFGNFWAISDFD